MKINKINLAFFISVTSIFTLNIAMEAPEKEVETTYLESALLNQANLAEMPDEIKIKIINNIVNNIIENNKKLSTVDVIKLIAKNLLPLRQINKEFNNLIKFYVRNDLIKILISYGFKPLTIVDLLNQSTLSNTPVEIQYLILDNLVQNIINNNKDSSVIDIIKSIVKELLPLRQINREFYELIDDYISRGALNRMLKFNNGIDINQKDARGNTALINAIKIGQPGLAKLIIELGADTNAKGAINSTPLLWAAAHGYEDLVNLLIKLGANVNAKTINNETALTEAAHQNNVNIIRLLINAGANVNNKGFDGNTALINAAYNGCNDIVSLLIALGANINAIDNLGYTALIRAIDEDHKNTALLLISLGADASIRPRNGRTALDIAKSKGYEDIIEALQAHNAF